MMSGSVDYKWRKRMCHKWQEEMRQQQQQQQLKPAYIPHLANRSLRNFIEDPMNLQKLFLPRRTLQLLAQRPDFQRLVKACFVRVRYAGGYRVAQILGFGKWRSCSEPNFILRIDSNPRMFALEQLANGYFERGELLDWQYAWQANNFELPSRRSVDHKYKAIVEAKLQAQLQLHKLAKSKASLLLHDGQRCGRKYLVEPMDCYKPYLPKQLPALPLAIASSKCALEPHAACGRKKISLEEYRERCIKKKI